MLKEMKKRMEARAAKRREMRFTVVDLEGEMTATEGENACYGVGEQMIEEDMDSDEEFDYLFVNDQPSLNLRLEESVAQEARHPSPVPKKKKIQKTQKAGKQLLLRKAVTGQVGLTSPGSSGSDTCLSSVS